jgi:quinol monooxygenase YgiN
MVQLIVKLVTPESDVHELVHALRAVMRGARQARGCSFAQVCLPAIDPGKVSYVEEWDDAEQLQQQFGSERFLRLLAIIETASEQPVVEFRIVSQTHGLEYITAARSAKPHRTATRQTEEDVNTKGVAE